MGVVLLVGITALLVSGVGVFTSGVVDEVTSPAPEATFEFDVEDDGVVVTHMGGDTLDGDQLLFDGAAREKDDLGSITEWQGESVTAGDSAVVSTTDGRLWLIWEDPDSSRSSILAAEDVPSTVGSPGGAGGDGGDGDDGDGGDDGGDDGDGGDGGDGGDDGDGDDGDGGDGGDGGDDGDGDDGDGDDGTTTVEVEYIDAEDKNWEGDPAIDYVEIGDIENDPDNQVYVVASGGGETFGPTTIGENDRGRLPGTDEVWSYDVDITYTIYDEEGGEVIWEETYESEYPLDPDRDS